MRLHQIRYDVAITPWDITWNVIALHSGRCRGRLAAD
jgi:hypothetical protein